MNLLNYLQRHYYTKEELLQVTKLTAEDFSGFQKDGLMPLPSYKLSIQVSCESFFGNHVEHEDTEYYAKGYASWLGLVQICSSKERVFETFYLRYKQAINMLKAASYASDNEKINKGLNDHIRSEWGHFLNGTYGLCTKSGLPEDIAAKELATLEIEELVASGEVKDSDHSRLKRAVDLLDDVSSLFAPHEREKSSRERLINQVRKKYRL